MIRTVIFDFGNVIAFFDHRRTVERLAPHTDKTAAELYALIYQSDLEPAYEKGHFDTPELIRRVRTLTGLRCSDADFAAAFVDIFTPNDEVCALIPRLKPRYRLVLASNTNDLHYQHLCRAFAPVLRHFEAKIVSHQVGHRKPEPGFFAACEAVAEAEAHECVFIDDLAANVAGAAARGWRTIHYRPPLRLADALAAQGVALDV